MWCIMYQDIHVNVVFNSKKPDVYVAQLYKKYITFKICKILTESINKTRDVKFNGLEQNLQNF